MHTCGIRINAKLVKESSFRINAKLVKEELKIKSDNIQQNLQFVDLHFVKSEEFSLT